MSITEREIVQQCYVLYEIWAAGQQNSTAGQRHLNDLWELLRMFDDDRATAAFMAGLQHQKNADSVRV